jgi:hypothetical protein
LGLWLGGARRDCLGCLIDGLVVARASTWAWDAGIAGVVSLAAPFVFRIGVRVDDAGVRVVNMLTTKRFRWDEIARFELAPAGVYPYAGHVILNSGRNVPISAITVPRFSTERFKPGAQKPIDELNALLAAAREHRNLPAA